MSGPRRPAVTERPTHPAAHLEDMSALPVEPVDTDPFYTPWEREHREPRGLIATVAITMLNVACAVIADTIDGICERGI